MTKPTPYALPPTLHMVFACKYRHNIFLHTHVKTLYKTILRNTARFHAITIKEIGFANDHVHLIVDPGPNRTPAQTAKLLKA